MPALEQPLTAPFVSLENASGSGKVTGEVIDFGAVESGFAVLAVSSTSGSVNTSIAIEVSWDGSLFLGVANDNAVNAQYQINFPARFVRVDAYNLDSGETITVQVIPL